MSNKRKNKQVKTNTDENLSHSETQRLTINQATNILVHLFDKADGVLSYSEIQELARNSCVKILDGVGVDGVGGCPLCQS